MKSNSIQKLRAAERPGQYSRAFARAKWRENIRHFRHRPRLQANGFGHRTQVQQKFISGPLFRVYTARCAA